jgi:hypothetical protein
VEESVPDDLAAFKKKLLQNPQKYRTFARSFN